MITQALLIPSIRRILLEKEKELRDGLLKETTIRTKLDVSMTTKDELIHELEVKVEMQKERMKTLQEQVRDNLKVTKYNQLSFGKHFWYNVCTNTCSSY